MLLYGSMLLPYVICEPFRLMINDFVEDCTWSIYWIHLMEMYHLR